jgi:hypothetical protein
MLEGLNAQITEMRLKLPRSTASSARSWPCAATCGQPSSAPPN